MNRTILVVESDDMVRMLLRDLLQQYGYRVVTAQDGAEGVRRARRDAPDLVLMEVNLPVMDGLTAARVLKADPRTQGVRIVSFTTLYVEALVQELKEAGFDGHLWKPQDIHRLADKLREFIC